jgi:hypothetical protein
MIKIPKEGNMIPKFKNQNSITGVTSRLIDVILEMPLDQKLRLLSDLTQTQCDSSRRMHDRKDHLINVHFVVNNQLYNGFINNISSGGVFIKCPQNMIQRLNTGQSVILTFDHPDRKIHIKITGEIARIEDSGFGVNFDELLQGLVISA